MILLKLEVVAWRCSLKNCLEQKCTRKHLRWTPFLKSNVKLQILPKDQSLRKEIIPHFERSYSTEKLIFQGDCHLVI